MKTDCIVKIVAFGDSITLAMRQEPRNKWVNIVQSEINQQLPYIDLAVINSGVGGNTSREGLARIDEDVIAHDPDIVLVEFGGNDTTPDSQREVSLDEFQANLTEILRQLTACKAKMILLTFPPIINEWHCWKDGEKYVDTGGLDEYVEQYRQLTQKFAAENDLILIDIDHALREACKNHSSEEVILPDGVHLTAMGNNIVAKKVIGTLLAAKLF